MRIGFLTRTLPPYVCGIGDHTMRLGRALNEMGHDVRLFAGRGNPGENIHIIGDEWNRSDFQQLSKLIVSMNLDHLALQYTPLAFSQGNWRIDGALMEFWRDISASLSTSLIVHETYYRDFRRLPSLLRGTWQKFALNSLASISSHVFSASEPLIQEMSHWKLKRPALRLPIGSTIDVAPADRIAVRDQYGLTENDIVLTLFGCGQNLQLMQSHFHALQEKLSQSRIPHAWLLLGGVPRTILSPSETILDPGWLPPDLLSSHLQMSDIFVMPHFMGISAKRSTLCAAMAFELPVVGTKGKFTDAFWSDVPGVALIDESSEELFADAVLDLCCNAGRRRSLGSQNLDYFRIHLTWPTIAARFSSAIQLERQE